MGVADRRRLGGIRAEQRREGRDQPVSDFNLKLFPQRAVRINAGYGRSMAKGRYNPSYSFERDLFQLLGDTPEIKRLNVGPIPPLLRSLLRKRE